MNNIFNLNQCIGNRHLVFHLVTRTVPFEAIRIQLFTDFLFCHSCQVGNPMSHLIAPPIFLFKLPFPFRYSCKWGNFLDNPADDRSSDDATELARIFRAVDGNIDKQFRIIRRCKSDERYDIRCGISSI